MENACIYRCRGTRCSTAESGSSVAKQNTAYNQGNEVGEGSFQRARIYVIIQVIGKQYNTSPIYLEFAVKIGLNCIEDGVS